MALPIPSPAALIDLGRYAAGQAVEAVAALATVPVRLMALLGQTELLVSRITVLADEAERLVRRVETVVASADEVTGLAAGVVATSGTVAGQAGGVVVLAGDVATRAGAVVGSAGQVAGRADGVVGQAATTSAQAAAMLEEYRGTLSKAAPLAARFVDELSPEEVTAAIRMVDELPRLREHLSHDVLPLLTKLDQVGPDLHALLAVTQDLHLAIAGLPGLKKLRRRGEERLAEEESA